jgi:hypothetical protein
VASRYHASPHANANQRVSAALAAAFACSSALSRSNVSGLSRRAGMSSVPASRVAGGAGASFGGIACTGDVGCVTGAWSDVDEPSLRCLVGGGFEPGAAVVAAGVGRAGLTSGEVGGEAAAAAGGIAGRVGAAAGGPDGVVGAPAAGGGDAGALAGSGEYLSAARLPATLPATTAPSTAISVPRPMPGHDRGCRAGCQRTLDGERCVRRAAGGRRAPGPQAVIRRAWARSAGSASMRRT